MRESLKSVRDSEGNVTSKFCPKCNSWKDREFWPSDVARADGLQSRCKDCRNKHGKIYIQTYRAKELYKKRFKYKEKFIVVAHYSMGEMCCRECRCPDFLALQIDHIDGGGSQHRREVVSHNGCHTYRWLINNDFPEGFQVLCANCNVIKRVENKECGRKKQETVEIVEISEQTAVPIG